jgi:hypothetical protein
MRFSFWLPNSPPSEYLSLYPAEVPIPGDTIEIFEFFNIVTLRKSMPDFATKNPNENQIKLPTYREPILLYSNSHPSDLYSLTTPPGDLFQFHNLGNVRQSRSGWSCRRYRETKGLVGSEAYHSTICCHPHTTPPTTEYHQSTVIRMWKRTA